MPKIINEKIVLDKRLAKYLAVIREVCRNPSKFKQKMDVQVGHIAWRAAETGKDVRNAMNNERIASIILNGAVNEQHSRVATPIEIAIEGKFAELSFIKYNPIEEIRCRNVGMRVVVREGSSKHIIVTLYPLQDQNIDIERLPEVPNEIW